jgi:hypothetical protein
VWDKVWLRSVSSQASLKGQLGSQVRVGLTLRFLRIRDNGHPGLVLVSTRDRLIQSVISADTSRKIWTFPMIEGMNQETFELYCPK